MKNSLTISLALFMFLIFSLFLSVHKAQSQDNDTAVIETEISLDQIVSDAETKATTKQKKDTMSSKVADLSFDEQQLMQINASLKNAIEENKKMITEKEALEKELGDLRGERQIRINRVNVLSKQRDNLQAEIDALQKQQQKYLDQLADLEKRLAQKEKEYEQKLENLKIQQEQKEREQKEAMAAILPRATDPNAVAESQKQLVRLKNKARKTLRRVKNSAKKATRQVSKLSHENKKLREDAANMHYNLGNLFFEQRKYRRAANEYKRVVDIMPYNSAAHYNLAFISGDYLEDYDTALKHYKQYLYLEPDAEDVYFVREKMLEAELFLRTKIDSPVDPR